MLTILKPQNSPGQCPLGAGITACPLGMCLNCQARYNVVMLSNELQYLETDVQTQKNSTLVVLLWRHIAQTHILVTTCLCWHSTYTSTEGIANGIIQLVADITTQNFGQVALHMWVCEHQAFQILDVPNKQNGRNLCKQHILVPLIVVNAFLQILQVFQLPHFVFCLIVISVSVLRVGVVSVGGVGSVRSIFSTTSTNAETTVAAAQFFCCLVKSLLGFIDLHHLIHFFLASAIVASHRVLVVWVVFWHLNGTPGSSELAAEVFRAHEIVLFDIGNQRFVSGEFIFGV